MSYIVWDNGECLSFRTAEEAWKYITPVLRTNPMIKFAGFGRTVTNITNRVAVLRNYDTLNPWKDAPPYMQPKEQP